MGGQQVFRGIKVSPLALKLVQQMDLKGKTGRMSKPEIVRAIVKHPNFAKLYTEIAALYGEFEGVDALSRLILGIKDPDFSKKNLVVTNFDGALRGPANRHGLITNKEVFSQEQRMRQALDEFMSLAKHKKIAWPTTPFEDATNIEKFDPADQANVISYGQKLWQEFSGRVMALGVGGSSNGSRVITSAFDLKQAVHAGFTFAGDYLNSIFADFDFKNGHIIVTSLSGTTSEPLTNLLMVINKLKKAGVPEGDYKKHLTFLTGGEGSVLREMAKVYDVPTFYCKPNEGGRFSIWTVIGTLWAEANGVDALQAKAGAMLSHYRLMESPMRDNPAMILAAIANVARNKGVTLFENLMFSEMLAAYGDFLGQAWGESVEEDGLGLRVRVDVCPNWQHIAANGLLAVPQGIMAQMVWIRHSQDNVKMNIPSELRHLSLGKGTLADLQGKSLDQYMAEAVKGGWSSFVGRGIPTALTMLDHLDEFHLGQMTQDTFGLVGFFGGSNGLGIKTYEQPWVVLHKALGRGETKMNEQMPSGKECVEAMRHFEKFLAI